MQPLNWDVITQELDAEGYAVIPGLLSACQIQEVSTHLRDHFLEAFAGEQLLTLDALQGSTLLEALSPAIDSWGRMFAPSLHSITQRWRDRILPTETKPRLAPNHEKRKTTISSTLISSIGTGENQQLADRGGSDLSPIQLVVLLSEPGIDFTGGEFVVVERRPRMQSRAMVVPMAFGDAALIAVTQRPVVGMKGCYRVSAKHGVSRVLSGHRVGLELYFGAEPNMDRAQSKLF